MSLLDNVAIPRKTMVLFFIVDTSGSMIGSKIGEVNSAIEEVIPELKDLSESNADAQIKIAVLKFSTSAEWVTADGPVEAENFYWTGLEALGVTALGEACTQLNEKLSTKAFMKEATGSFAPAIFLLSDGGPTDDYKKGLEKLKQNNWFKKAIKVAVAIGSDADKGVLEEFTGTSEAVLEVHSGAMLRKMIRFVSVRASEVASKSANVNSNTSANLEADAIPYSTAGIPNIEVNTKQEELNKELQNFTVETAGSENLTNYDDEW